VKARRKVRADKKAAKKAADAYAKLTPEEKKAADKYVADKKADRKRYDDRVAADKKAAADKAAADKKEADSESDSSDDEEDLLKISINKAGRKEISKEWTDVEHVWKRIEHSRPVRNLGSSVHRWEESKELKDIEALDKKFLKTPRG